MPILGEIKVGGASRRGGGGQLKKRRISVNKQKESGFGQSLFRDRTPFPGRGCKIIFGGKGVGPKLKWAVKDRNQRRWGSPKTSWVLGNGG